MALKKDLLDILACPKCKGDLNYKEAEKVLVCEKCKLMYLVQDDIPVMIIEEALPLK
ncbi:MAG TPA: Trm112 family protein [Dissulfurispiraceae bacterium]|nr:Trm112 family protein [Dissulfurispiraceae bacterium]